MRKTVIATTRLKLVREREWLGELREMVAITWNAISWYIFTVATIGGLFAYVHVIQTEQANLFLTLLGLLAFVALSTIALYIRTHESKPALRIFSARLFETEDRKILEFDVSNIGSRQTAVNWEETALVYVNRLSRTIYRFNLDDKTNTSSESTDVIEPGTKNSFRFSFPRIEELDPNQRIQLKVRPIVGKADSIDLQQPT
jgi:hypothetical protein